MSLSESQIKTWNKTKNTTILARMRCPSDWAKKTKEQQMAGKSCLWFEQRVLFLFPLTEKKNQAETKGRSLDSESITYYETTSNPLFCEKEWRNQVRGTGGKTTGEHTECGEGAKERHRHAHTPLLKEKKTWESRNLREANRASAPGQQEWRRTKGFWGNWWWGRGVRTQHGSPG